MGQYQLQNGEKNAGGPTLPEIGNCDLFHSMNLQHQNFQTNFEIHFLFFKGA